MAGNMPAIRAVQGDCESIYARQGKDSTRILQI